jgi:hypothetical protein
MNSLNEPDTKKWLHFLSAIIVVTATLVLSLGAFSKNLSAGKNLMYVLIAACALYLAFERATYLPFLGTTVSPCSVLKESIPENANYEKRVAINGFGKKVLFWAAEPDNEHLSQLKDWRKAYLGFENAGVAIVGSDNMVTLRVRKPQPYTVPVAGRLEAHIHYRVCANEGQMGPIQTVFLDEPDAPLQKNKKEFYVSPDTMEPFYASAVY